MPFFPWWQSHPVMWQNPYLPNGRWAGHCSTVSCVWEDVLGTTLLSLDENSARGALACLCCRCFPFTQPNPDNPTCQQSFPVPRQKRAAWLGQASSQGQDRCLLCVVGSCCFTALQGKPTFEDLALAEEILLSLEGTLQYSVYSHVTANHNAAAVRRW